MSSFGNASGGESRIPPPVSTFRDEKTGILLYGHDNRYPLECRSLVDTSPTLRACIRAYSDFINGDGFADASLGNSLAADNGDLLRSLTFDDLLQRISIDIAIFGGCAIHIQYTRGGKIYSATPLPFESVRIVTDKEGKQRAVAHDPYSWYYPLNNRNTKYTSYNKYCINDVINEITESEEGYLGQILYYTVGGSINPYSTFHSVIPHARAEIEIGYGKEALAKNNMTGTLAIMMESKLLPDGSTDPRAVSDMKAEISRSITGARNSGGAIVITTDGDSSNKKISDIFQTLTPQKVDDLYEYAETSSKQAILSVYSMPQEIIGSSLGKGTGITFTNDVMLQAFDYYNSFVQDSRRQLSRVMKELVMNFYKPVGTSVEIKPKKYIATPTQ